MNIQTHVETCLKETEYDFSKYTLRDFWDYLQRTRQVRFELFLCDLFAKSHKSIMGCWLHAPKPLNSEVFLIEQSIPPLCTERTLAHELGHYLGGHKTAYLSTEDYLALREHKSVRLSPLSVMQTRNFDLDDVFAEGVAQHLQNLSVGSADPGFWRHIWR